MYMVDSESPCRKIRNRKGTATVELAVCLPIMVIIVFGFIESTNAIFLKERLTSAAYEGARRATAPSQTSATAVASANSVLTQYGISGGTITITPAVTSTTATGTSVSVSVTAPFSSNSCMQPFIIGKTIGNITATVVMIRQ
jgi:Flp pilus assembly protein TadG